MYNSIRKGVNVLEYTRGQRLTELMAKPENKHKNATYLGEKIGKNSAYISKLRSDTLKAADNMAIKIIAEELGSSFEWLQFGEEGQRVYYSEPTIFNRLPEDLKEFVVSEENTPYIIFAKQLKRYDLEKMLENISDTDMRFLLSALYLHLKNDSTK